MFTFNNDTKRKLIRDLMGNERLRSYSFEFKGKKLICCSDDGMGVLIDYNLNFDVRSYNQLLSGTTMYLLDITQVSLDIKRTLMNLSYPAFIKKIKARKYRKEKGGEGVVIYELDDYMYKFSAHTVYFDRTGQHEMTVFITPEILKAHKVSIETFFQDVKECYAKDGVDILADTYGLCG